MQKPYLYLCKNRRNTLKEMIQKAEICSVKEKRQMKGFKQNKRYYPIPQSSKLKHIWIDLPEITGPASYFLKARVLSQLQK